MHEREQNIRHLRVKFTSFIPYPFSVNLLQISIQVLELSFTWVKCWCIWNRPQAFNIRGFHTCLGNFRGALFLTSSIKSLFTISLWGSWL